MSVDARFLTVGALIQRVFPDGTRNVPEPGTPAGNGGQEPPHIQDPYGIAPDFPPDLFAVAGLLIQVAGAYNYMVPQGDVEKWPSPCVCLSADELVRWSEAGKQWSRHYPHTPPLVQELWEALWQARENRLFHEPERDHAAPAWWMPAFGLLVIADEACVDVGYLHARDTDLAAPGDKKWVALTVDTLLRPPTDDGAPELHRRVNQPIASICMKADRDVVCVQPKSHTPEVGCTLRTLAHNLALLPPRGQMRAHWQRPPQLLLPEARTEMRLLLIPFPYQIEPDWFAGEPAPPSAMSHLPWGWFDIHQRWLPRDPGELVRFVAALIARTEDVDGIVNGVLFPECALDWESYRAIADYLRDQRPAVEFFVAGASTNWTAQKGNYALSTHFFDEPGAGGDIRMAVTTSRAKHHRWRLEQGQIEAYGLQAALDPKVMWWEKIPLHQREIHIDVIRSASVFTTMICEDLARSEPAHEVLRAIGPNIVFVLLMDGPQLPFRWSARYATGLSDDPGSSVLTFTSRALIARQNRRGGRAPNWTVALWKDAKNAAYPIECLPQHHAVAFKVKGEKSTEATLDGRLNDSGFAWRRSGGAVPIALDPTKHRDLIERFAPPELE
jgi:hypothetical protein